MNKHNSIVALNTWILPVVTFNSCLKLSTEQEVLNFCVTHGFQIVTMTGVSSLSNKNGYLNRSGLEFNGWLTRFSLISYMYKDEIFTKPLILVICELQGWFQAQPFVSSVDILRKYSLVTMVTLLIVQ